MKDSDPRPQVQLLEEIERLRARLDEAEQTLDAIRHGEVDALVVTGPQGERVFSLTSAEHTYRVIVETMHEAALVVLANGTILFCNQRFCELLKASMEEAIGGNLSAFAAPPQHESLREMLADAQVRPFQKLLRLQATDGTPVPTQIAASPLAEEGVTRICLVASDLTEVEASARSLEEMRLRN